MAKMKPAAKPTAKKAKAPEAKATAKSTKKLEPKVKLEIAAKASKEPKGKKGDKKSEQLEVKATLAPGGENAEEEDDMEATSGSSGAAESGLAIAAASAETAAGSLKNFRHHPDIENFYRFIFENDLRYEALEFIDVIVSQRGMTKAVKASKSKPH